MPKKHPANPQKAPGRRRVALGEAIGRRRRGRPTLYRPEYARKMIEWAESKVGCERYTTRSGDIKWAFKDYPYFEEFAKIIGVDRTTLYRWATDVKGNKGTPLHPEFCNAYARVLDRQAQLLQMGAMSGAIAQPTAVLMVKNHPNLLWKDKVETVSSVKLEFADAAALDAIYASNWEKSREMNKRVGKDIGSHPSACAIPVALPEHVQASTDDE